MTANQARYLKTLEQTAIPYQTAARLGLSWHTIAQWHQPGTAFAADYDRIDDRGQATA